MTTQYFRSINYIVISISSGSLMQYIHDFLLKYDTVNTSLES